MIYEVCRGQYETREKRIQTRLPSITFSSLEAAVIYAYEPNNRNDVVIQPMVLKAKIRIDNPLFDNEDCFCDFEDLIPKLGFNFMWQMAIKHEDWIYNTNNWQEGFSERYSNVKEVREADPNRITELYMDAFPLLDDAEFIAQAIACGYDGAIHMGNGETCDEKEYRIFSEKQIIRMEMVPEEQHYAA